VYEQSPDRFTQMMETMKDTFLFGSHDWEKMKQLLEE
jgi:hypothetical protein